MAQSTLTDPLGRSFTLANHTWYGHILKGHPEMRPHFTLVEQAVTAPLSIYGPGPRDGVFVAAVVDIALGIVKTAYLSRTMTGASSEWTPSPPIL